MTEVAELFPLESLHYSASDHLCKILLKRRRGP